MPEHTLALTLESPFSQKWTESVERLGSYNQRLLVQLMDNWNELREILEAQLDVQTRFPITDFRRRDINSYKAVRSEASRMLLHEPAVEMRRRKFYRRARMAVDNYRESLEGLVRSLPVELSLSGAQADAAMLPEISKGLIRRLVRHRAHERNLALKAIVANELQRLFRAQSEIEGRYFLVLALAQRCVRKPWDATRAAIDAEVLGRPALGEVHGQAIRKEFQALVRKAELVLSEWRAFLDTAVDRLARRILTALLLGSGGNGRTGRLRVPASTAHWEMQSRIAETEIAIEQSLEQCEEGIQGLVRRSVDGAGEELEKLHAEIDEVLHWLRAQLSADSQAEFPLPKADVVPSSSRIADFESSLQLEVMRLPTAFEMPAAFCARPRRYTWYRKLHPMETFQQAFLRSGRQEIRDLLRQIETEHHNIVQQIERARQVVVFARETAGSGPERDKAVVQEATQNAISLLEFCRTEQPEWQADAEMRLARVVASVFVEGRLIMGLRRLGVLTYLSRQGIRRGLVLTSRRIGSGAGRVLERLLRLLEGAMFRILVYIGWRQPSDEAVEVITRPYLPEEFTTDLNAKELPSLYRRLFEFEPLKDPRFLVGRDAEMNAISAARSLWEAGRPVAIILAGQRGSGKTSLINCALKRVFADQEVIQGEFRERLVKEVELRSFLNDLFEAGGPDQLESFLDSRRRVVILEELERTFLRHVGCFGAIRGLLRIISATRSRTLWILTTNQIGFHFLDAAVDLGKSFSHRINAGTATRENLRQAILLRHNLSGLRLRFAVAPAPSSNSMARRLSRHPARPATPERAFFDILSRESAGVYRSAFEIWLQQIDTVQEGTLLMKPLLVPDLSPVVDGLSLEDLFTLLAIPQHGSLTAEEHAAVFQKGVGESKAQLDELLAGEIIEFDPAHPGFRIRPETMRVVMEALYHHNLL